MTTTAQLRELTVQALIGATAAGENVFSPRTWPTWSGIYPVLMVRAPEESGESFGRNGAPAFTVTSTIHISARVQVPALPGDAGAAHAEAILEAYREQIKAAVINNPLIMPLLQQYPFFRTELTINSDGEQPIGEVVVRVGMEFVQGPDDFFPVPAVPLQGMDIRVQEPDGTTVPGLTIDLPQ